MSRIELSFGMPIPMRDGATLNCTLYKPRSQNVPLPVIFTLTPYGADTYHDHASYFAQNGYVFALIDCRGRGNSTGQFVPNRNEGRDGYDIAEWLAHQPWSDSQVAMWGASYAGHNQWSTLKEAPAHLRTIVPVAAAAPGINFPMVNNIHFTAVMQWLTLTNGKYSNRTIFSDENFWIDKYWELYSNHLPYADLDRVVGNLTTCFQDYIRHSKYDEYWQAMNPTATDYGRMSIPILTITGQYDGNQSGALYYHQMHLQHASPEAQALHYLIIGPWDHAGTREPTKQVGGLSFATASLIDLNTLHKEWYDWILKGGAKPLFLKKRVASYVLGTEEWAYADSIEDFCLETKALYLDSTGERPHDVFHSGILTQSRVRGLPHHSYVYDPLDLSLGALEREPQEAYLTDQRRVLNLSRTGLIYHSDPLETDVLIIGHIRASLWISIDVRDTDFEIVLYEIRPDGSSIFLTNDVKRARFNNSLEDEELVLPGEIIKYEFKTARFVARQVSRNSRLRLTLSSPNSIHWEKNYNSGRAVANESADDAVAAHVTVHCDADHPSHIQIPLAKW